MDDERRGDDERRENFNTVRRLIDGGMPVGAARVMENLGVVLGNKELQSWRRGDQGHRRQAFAFVVLRRRGGQIDALPAPIVTAKKSAHGA